ncbi:MAG: hypothetical protein JJ844_07075 [Prochlorococcus marinus CUG1435]|nr:hypothetical protein [Prochlorococcus marinus CUG1435]
MRKRNLLFPLFLGSLFITSNVDSAIFDLYEKSNNNLLLAGSDCGGPSSGTSIQKKRENNLKKAEKSLRYFKSKKAEAEARGESTEKIDKKIEKWEKKIIRLDPDYFTPILENMGGDPNTLAPMTQETQDAKPKVKIDISKLDDVGPRMTEGLKDKTKKFTAKLAIASISKISAKIVKLEDEFKNYNAKSIDDRFKKYDEINSKIQVLKNLQKKIDDFLNFNIDNVVYILGLWDQLDNPVVETTEVIKKDNEFKKKYESLVEELKAAGLYFKDYDKIARKLSEKYALTGKQPTLEEKKAAGIDNYELENSLIDLYLLTVRSYRTMVTMGSKK